LKFILKDTKQSLLGLSPHSFTDGQAKVRAHFCGERLVTMSDDGEVPSRYKMPTAEQKAHAKRLVALYDYEPTLDDTDIALQQGKVVYGVELQGDWWWGYNSKRSGIFPANYVEEERFDDTDTDNDPEVPVHNQDEEQPQESQSDGASEINLPPAELEQQDEDSSDDDESAPPSAPARSSPRASPDAAAATSRRQRVSSGGRSQDSKLIPGLNLRWVAADNLHLRHTLLLWNGSFSAFVRAELLLTDNFLIEAIYFTEDLPELTVYPLYKLYIDADQKIDQGFLKRAYFSFRSQYYFCNLSTTANGGGHNELVRGMNMF